MVFQILSMIGEPLEKAGQVPEGFFRFRLRHRPTPARAQEIGHAPKAFGRESKPRSGRVIPWVERGFFCITGHIQSLPARCRKAGLSNIAGYWIPELHADFRSCPHYVRFHGISEGFRVVDGRRE